jgi:acyl-CoA dehydrogenase
VELGGAGLGLRELGNMCAAIGQGCGSSAMVLAMHHIQVACIARHGLQSPYFRQYLKDLVTHQWVLASMTSEVGTSGDTRSSVTAVERKGDHFVLNKDATTGSYCAHADAILVTCRRDSDAPRNDQVLVLVRAQDATLKQTTTWDTMGMRGTCSPGFKLTSSGPEEQVLPGSFADASAQTMVSYSHILWSGVWLGIASDAMARASAFVRAEARKNPGVVPPKATHLAKLSAEVQLLRNSVHGQAHEFDQIMSRPGGMEELLTISWALKMNNIKVSSSEMAPEIVHDALQIIGIGAYKNDSKLSVGRQYRDSLSAALMISNDRIFSKTASMLLVHKDD